MSQPDTPPKHKDRLDNHWAHPSDLDKHGYEVSERAEQAIDALRACPHVGRAVCDHYESELIQVYGDGRILEGEIDQIANDNGYSLHLATTRDSTSVAFPVASDDVSYAEYKPTDVLDERRQS
jgi:hypothetical protein